jgi:hypothetical protein
MARTCRPGKTDCVTCPIEDIRRDPRPLERGRYDDLHPDGRALIRGWRDRAGECRADESFESFIYLWFAFNSWAACVTGSDADHEWQRGLIADPTLNDLFDEQVSSRTRTADAVRRFAALWPIFRVSKLRERGIDYWSGIHDSRPEMTRAYIDAGAREFAPSCYLEHEQLPLDWGHTLTALYRVRCNLFHGEKARSSENDQRVVSAAYETLRAFLAESRLLG